MYNGNILKKCIHIPRYEIGYNNHKRYLVYHIVQDQNNSVVKLGIS